MTPKQLAAIERHGKQLLAIFPDATERDPVKLCKKLRRLEREGNQFALQLCNGLEFPHEDVAEAKAESILLKVDAVLRFTKSGPNVRLNRDPRGYALKIGDKDAAKLSIHKDWGGYGIIAPEFNKDGE